MTKHDDPNDLTGLKIFHKYSAKSRTRYDALRQLKARQAIREVLRGIKEKPSTYFTEVFKGIRSCDPMLKRLLFEQLKAAAGEKKEKK